MVNHPMVAWSCGPGLSLRKKGTLSPTPRSSEKNAIFQHNALTSKKAPFASKLWPYKVHKGGGGRGGFLVYLHPIGRKSFFYGKNADHTPPLHSTMSQVAILSARSGVVKLQGGEKI